MLLTDPITDAPLYEESRRLIPDDTLVAEVEAVQEQVRDLVTQHRDPFPVLAMLAMLILNRGMTRTETPGIQAHVVTATIHRIAESDWQPPEWWPWSREATRLAPAVDYGAYIAEEGDEHA